MNSISLTVLLVTALIVTIYIILEVVNALCDTKYDIVECRDPGENVYYIIKYYGIKLMKRRLRRDMRIVSYMNKSVSTPIEVDDNGDDGVATFSSEYYAKVYLIYMKKFYNDVGSSTKTTLTNDDIEKAAIISDGHA